MPPKKSDKGDKGKDTTKGTDKTKDTRKGKAKKSPEKVIFSKVAIKYIFHSWYSI